MDFGHCVGGTLFNPASLTHGCMGKHCGVKPSWDYRRCTEVKESPGAASGLGEERLGGTTRRPDNIPKRETRYHPKALRRAIKRIEMGGYSP